MSRYGDKHLWFVDANMEDAKTENVEKHLSGGAEHERERRFTRRVKEH